MNNDRYARFMELLCVIHRDGGHRIQKVGLDQAIEEAIALSVERLPETNDATGTT